MIINGPLKLHLRCAYHNYIWDLLVYNFTKPFEDVLAGLNSGHLVVKMLGIVMTMDFPRIVQILYQTIKLFIMNSNIQKECFMIAGMGQSHLVKRQEDSGISSRKQWRNYRKRKFKTQLTRNAQFVRKLFVSREK